MEPVKCVHRDDEIPRQWYNIQADLPHPLKPPLHLATGWPVTLNAWRRFFSWTSEDLSMP